jgi:DNA-binding response OmpR family regulator
MKHDRSSGDGSSRRSGEWLTKQMGVAEVEPSSLMIVLAGQQVRFARYTRPHVLVCDAELPDGGWRRIWKALSIGPRPPLLIVASHNADERLWAEVLNAVGYDGLLKPFRPEEVVWAIHYATGQQECAVCHAKPANAS